MSYVNVFGGNTIYPSDVSYLSIALDADTPLEWPLESSGNEDPAARIIDVTPDAAGHSVILPDATLTGAGQTILFNNLSVSYSFFVKDYAGNTIATVGTGTQWQVYLSDTATAAGTWRVFNYGASTATVQPSALSGYGLTVTSNTLSQSMPVTTFTTTPRTVLTTDRASIMTWTGTGAGVINLPSAATVGNNFFVSAKNSGGGDLTVTPAGGDTIDGAAVFVLAPEDSATFVTNGIVWYTLGFGQDATFIFDYTTINLTGQSSPYTLTGTELNRIAYEFTGTLTATMEIVVPPTVQQYWINNQTTGSYTLSLKTATQVVPVTVAQGYAAILYCKGTNVRRASARTATGPSLSGGTQGGTGITSDSTGDLIYASAATTLSRLADVATGNALISGGVGVAPSWGKIGLTTHVSGTLPVANGGTGATTLTGYVKGSGTSALTASSTIPASDISSGAALTKTDDTNVTLTLGGSPTTALLAATSITAGWTGQLSVARGGTGLGTTPTNGQLLIGNGTNYTLAAITAGSGISITNGAGSITIAATGTALSNWTEGVSTSSPNATVPVVYFTATNAATNVDAAILPKGTGAFTLAIADGTATGGNKRGTYAVDLQLSRVAATNVASGNYSFTAGYGNTTSGIYSVAVGYINVSTSDTSICLGANNTSSGVVSVAIGYFNTASASYSTSIGGRNNTASGTDSVVVGGSYGTTRSAYGFAYGGNPIATTSGASQLRKFILGRQTTDTTATVLAANTSAASSSNQVNLANNSAFFFKGTVIANVTGGGNTKGWTIEGVIKRGANAASTALVGTPTVTSSYAESGASTWSVAVTADTTNGCLAVTVTGQASTTIRWVASIETTEVTF